jgi:phosphoenolpyruvate carboxykinase (GTP)
MIKPPKRYAELGWKTRLIGDDIAWIRPGKDGRLYAINPENGFFGVVPGTNYKTNPNAMDTMRKNTIFTNVALTETGDPWWEGLPAPNGKVFDWLGEPIDSSSGKIAAHPNSRFTSPIEQYPEVSDQFNSPIGVPLAGIIFGGRRETTIPLVFESFDWNHGVFLGASMGVEQTAAAEGKVGVIRRDPMAMRPFIGYNVSAYFDHWLFFGTGNLQLPKIFYVNWFRKNREGKYIWPGFGENLRVIEWMIKRVENTVPARETEIGYMPNLEEIESESLPVSEEDMKLILSIDRSEWKREISDIGNFLDSLGKELPQKIKEEYGKLSSRFVD